MVHLIETENTEVFALRVLGTLSEEDYNLLVPAMEAEIARHGKINLYWEMKDFEGWTPGGLWEDVSFDVQHVTSFNRIALVGAKTWEKWLTNLLKPFTSADVKFYDYADRDEARAWVGL